jgi:hypothetical protein
MNTKFNGLPDEGQHIVYILPVAVADLPDEIREQLEGVDTLYAVHRTNGECLALVRERSMAFALARQNDLSPVSAH